MTLPAPAGGKGSSLSTQANAHKPGYHPSTSSDQGDQPLRRYPLWPPRETGPGSRNHNWGWAQPPTP